ncbi:MAG: TetR/AcrR family transcriptional regulator [Spirochaetes bacterium]|nr:TetR/AcrR family transcriptional regulator [Spirochaetota bacterium]
MKKPKSSHASSPGRRADILRAALACFIENGVAGTSVSDICAKAGVSVGSLYHHYRSMDGLAAALYLEGIRDYQNGMAGVLARDVTAREGVRAIVRYHLGWVEQNRDWARFLFHERHAPFMGDTEEEFRKMNSVFIANMAAWIARHVESGKLRRMPPDLYACVMLGPCQEFSRVFLSGNCITPIGKAIMEIGESVWNAVSAAGYPAGALKKR